MDHRHHRQELVEKLDEMETNQMLVFPHQRNQPRVTIHCKRRGEYRHWWVVKGLEENYQSTNIQAVIDHLLQIRPLESYQASITLAREEVSMGNVFDLYETENPLA
ncbi:hypothetical protein SAMN04488112_10664 [Melghirimyces thermohalophilus]|uniref:Uncharacterized protein n=1 Tax=Melghirimyces thermohalophilus TaxID=1236220 RepID=A0A1G6KNZ6_9BACL|nr:hypothetical protein [Melghirimyces thermohalophilus]SDC32265.1 hypothetical protein SAMN04488112_10664 [Melghirimyces thermohalophilus]